MPEFRTIVTHLKCCKQSQVFPRASATQQSALISISNSIQHMCKACIGKSKSFKPERTFLGTRPSSPSHPFCVTGLQSVCTDYLPHFKMGYVLAKMECMLPFCSYSFSNKKKQQYSRTLSDCHKIQQRRNARHLIQTECKLRRSKSIVLWEQ